MKISSIKGGGVGPTNAIRISIYFLGNHSLSLKLKCTEHDGKMAKNWGPARRLMLVISFEGLAHRGRQGGPQPAIAVE